MSSPLKSLALLASLCAALCLPSVAASGCGGSVADQPQPDGGDEGGIKHTGPPDDAGADAHVPLAPRCTEKRAPTPVVDGPGPSPLPDGGLSFFQKHPLPQLQDNGGPLLTSPRVVPIFFAGDPLADDLEDFVASMGCTAYWREAVGEYGIGDALAAPAAHLTEEAPAKITDAQIEAWLAKQITAAKSPLEAPTPNSVYVIFYPETTTITEQGARSCESFGGYHTEITVSGKHVAYAAIPRCDGFGGLSVFDAVTAATSHEIIEAATDPYNAQTLGYAYVDNDHLPWVFVLGGESGDLCAQEEDAFYQPDDFPFTVQRNWSNRAARAGGAPCVPKSTRPYFTAAPTLPNTVNLYGVPVSAVTVPVGGSAVVDVDLYTEKAGASLEVDAFDASQLLGTSGASTYTFDKTTGTGGDTLHLTISTPSGASTDPEIFALYVRRGGEQRIGWVGAVGH